MLAAVDVALEGTALFRQLANAGKGEHLEASAIGQDGAVPTAESVQTAGFFQYLCAWSEIEVIGVAQNDLCLNLFFEVADIDALHASHCADGHEDGRLDLSVVGGYQSGTSIAVWVCMLQLENHSILGLDDFRI